MLATTKVKLSEHLEDFRMSTESGLPFIATAAIDRGGANICKADMCQARNRTGVQLRWATMNFHLILATVVATAVILWPTPAHGRRRSWVGGGNLLGSRTPRSAGAAPWPVT
jgi:hypothetical protein